MSTCPEAHRRPHVLLAEDDADLRTTLSDMLGALGIEVEAVADGGRFLVAVAAHYDPGRSPADVDLIVADVGLPVCGGFDILDAIRAAGWKTPTLVMTGLVTPMVSMRVSKLHATLLVKPFDVHAFERAVAELLAARISEDRPTDEPALPPKSEPVLPPTGG